MWKQFVTFVCEHCGHREEVLLYVEGDGLDRASYEHEGCDDTNRRRIERMAEATCTRCGKSGFRREP